MAKPNYQFEKRQKELAKKNKKEEKRRQKLAGHTEPDSHSPDSAESATREQAGDDSSMNNQ